ncbi:MULTISPECIES: YoaK family protein [Sphingobium]|uniref:YoaK family protein n=1 Tax=Sphingobium sp. MI1205 TaxID=407020 RepID=UPI0007703AAB|nr:YoaK family protein [Sphingobium sp. MI1205]AMK17744.1 hypothetical protein K663_06815 [Sphingobium sp. MI1205]
MKRYDRRHWVLAAGLSALAGYVDVIGFLRLGGFFVSFMSGNSTRLAVGTVQGSGVAARAALIIALFIAGAALGAIVARIAGRWRKPVLLTLVAMLLGLGASGVMLSVPAMVVAMGLLNAVFLRDKEVSIGVTYMTGTLVKLGQGIGNALVGGDRTGWLPYALLWTGLMAGALMAAFLHAVLPVDPLWGATGWTLALALFAAKWLPRPGT